MSRARGRPWGDVKIQGAAVRIDGVAFQASRPEVLAHLASGLACPWGRLMTFRGTEAELVGCGLATLDMFEGVRCQRTRRDEHGDQWTLSRAGKRWTLERRLFATIWDEPRLGHGRVAAEAQVEAILARFTGPRE